MRVLVSTLISSPTAAHGGPVIAARQANALAAQGVEVRLAAPTVEGAPEAPAVERYSASSVKYGHFLDRRPDAGAVSALCGVIERFRPDIVYDVHGPAWAVEAATRTRVPVVSMMGDYAWFCRRNSLVDGGRRRCSGPESLDKCFNCLNRTNSAPRRLVNASLKHAAALGVRARKQPDWRFASLFLWEALREAEEYAASMRARIDRFVVGDRNARAFMLEHGIPGERIHSIAQCLPEDALRVRRHPGETRPGQFRPLRFAFVGRLQQEKGLHVLAQAFDALPDDVAVELWIIHSQAANPEDVEPLFPDAARFRRALAGGRIKLFRPGTSDELFGLMASADVGVVPSIAYESPSLTLLEFVAQRTPIVRSESEGMAHVIQDGINGRTFPYGDSGSLRSALLEIVATPALLDQWRERLPVIGSDAHYARELVDVFERVIAARGSAAA